MAIWYPGASHIAGKSILELTGLDQIGTPHDPSLNITQSFTYGVMFQPLGTPLPNLNYAILTKGHPTNPALGSISLEVINGYLRVYLHDVNSLNSLVHETNTPLLNTREIKHITVVWNYTTKDFDLYVDAVNTPVTVVTGGAFYSSAASMGLINTNSADMTFASASGKNNAHIKVYHEFMSPSAWDSVRIADLFDSIKYMGTYPPLDKIMFSSNQEGVFCIMSMNEDGTNRQVIFNNGTHFGHPRVSKLGQYISCTQFSTLPSSLLYVVGQGVTMPISGGTPTSSGNVSSQSFPCRILEDTGFIYYGEDGYYDFVSRNTFPTIGAVTHLNSNSPWGLDVSYDNQYIVYNHGYSAIYRSDIAGLSVVALENAGVDTIGISPTINQQSTKVGYSKKVFGYYQVFTRDIDGTNLLQLTTDNWNNHFAGFTKDGTRAIFNSYDSNTSTYQIHLINVDGTNRYNISNNNFQDWFGDGY